MTSAATSATPKPLIFARQIAGMAILALANPLVWYSNEPVLRWLESWGVPVLIALAATGTVGWWGWLGVIPLATGLFRVCPAYSLFGLNSCPLHGPKS